MTTAPADPLNLAEGDLLGQVDVLQRTQVETSAALLVLVADFAAQHHAGTVDPIAAQLAGHERAVRLGGEGTPLVAEFAPAVLEAVRPCRAGCGESRSPVGRSGRTTTSPVVA